MLEIIPFRKDYLLPAAELFIQNFRKLRQAIPILPDTLEHSDIVCARLEELFGPCPGAIALQDGQMVGYMGWYIIPNFRNNRYNGAYCPEWSHAHHRGEPAQDLSRPVPRRGNRVDGGRLSGTCRDFAGE